MTNYELLVIGYESTYGRPYVVAQSHRLQVDVPKNKKARVIDHSGFFVVAGAGLEPTTFGL